MDWNEAKKRSDEGGGPGVFVRLENDGDKVVVVFVGEPECRELLWDKKKEQYADLTDEDRKAGKKGSPKFKFNVFVPAEKAMKILDINNNTFKDVIAVREKYGLDKWSFEIKRNGKKGDTKTTYAILPEKELTASDRAEMQGHKLHDLKAAKDDESTDMNSHDKTTTTNGTAAAPAEAPVVTLEQATALVGRLKPMSKDKIDSFLAKFAIKSLRFLKASDLAAATAMIDGFEGKTAGPAEDPLAL